MSRPRVVLSFVEDGWQSARMLSIALVRELGLETRHYIKGRVDPCVLEMVTPYAGMRLISIPRRWFPMVCWWLLVWGCLRRRWCLIVVDRQRTHRWAQRVAQRWPTPVIEAAEQFQRLVYRWNHEWLELPAVIQRLQEISS